MKPRGLIFLFAALSLILIMAACGTTNVVKQPNTEDAAPPLSEDVDLTISGTVDTGSADQQFSAQAEHLRAYMYPSEGDGYGQVIKGTFDPETGSFQVELPAMIPDDLLSKDFESLCRGAETDLTVSTSNLRVSRFSELNLETPDDDNGPTLEDGEPYFGYITFVGPAASLSGMTHWFYSNTAARVIGTCTYDDPWKNVAYNLNLKAGWNYVVSEVNGEGLTTFTSVAALPDAFFWYYILSV